MVLSRLERNEKSWYLMVQEALPEVSEMVKLLKLLKQFCNKHKIKLRLAMDGMFEVEGRPTAHSEFITSSLNELRIKEHFLEIVEYVNGSNGTKLKQLAECLCGKQKVFEPGEDVILKRDSIRANIIDRGIRQKYELKVNKGKRINWSLFSSLELQNVEGYVDVLLKDSQTFYDVHNQIITSGFDYDTGYMLTENQAMAFAIHEIAMKSGMAMEEVATKYAIKVVDNTIDMAFQKEKLYEVFANIALTQKPSFFIISSGNHWAMLGLVPDLKDFRKLSVVYMNSINESKRSEKSALGKSFAKSLIKMIKSEELGFGLTDSKIINLSKPQQLSNNCGVVVAMNIADIAMFHHGMKAIGQDLDWSIFVGQPSTITLSGDAVKDIERLTRMGQERFAQLRSLNNRRILEKARKAEAVRLSNVIEGKVDDSARRDSAKAVLEIIGNYKPTIYDLFGYDFSGRRKRLINQLIEMIEDTEIWRFYGVELDQLRKSRRQGRLYQDLKFGIFIDRLIEDSEISKAALKSQIHSSILEIARASRSEYRNHKMALAKCVIAELADSMQDDLVKEIYEVLQKGTLGTLGTRLEKKINKWIAKKLKIIGQLPNKEQKKALNLELVNVLSEWTMQFKLACNIMSQVKGRSSLPEKVAIKNFEYKDAGKLIGAICFHMSQIAKGNSKIKLNGDVSPEVFESYYEHIGKLPDSIRRVHEKYVETKQRQIQAQRLLKVLQDFRPKPLLAKRARNKMFDSILGIIKNPQVYAVFSKCLNGLVEKNEWMKSPKELMKDPVFGGFIREVIKESGIPEEEILLHRSLKKLVDIAEYAPRKAESTSQVDKGIGAKLQILKTRLNFVGNTAEKEVRANGREN